MLARQNNDTGCSKYALLDPCRQPDVTDCQLQGKPSRTLGIPERHLHPAPAGNSPRRAASRTMDSAQSRPSMEDRRITQRRTKAQSRRLVHEQHHAIPMALTLDRLDYTVSAERLDGESRVANDQEATRHQMRFRTLGCQVWKVRGPMQRSPLNCCQLAGGYCWPLPGTGFLGKFVQHCL